MRLNRTASASLEPGKQCRLLNPGRKDLLPHLVDRPVEISGLKDRENFSEVSRALLTELDRVREAIVTDRCAD